MATLTPTLRPVVNKERMRMWTRALKSGQYKQGKGSMRAYGGGYCCLGVAMDIAFANGCEVTGVENWGTTSSLPPKVAEWYGLPTGDRSDPRLVEVGALKGIRFQRASVLNDSKVPFGIIADQIIYTYDLNIDDES